MCNCKISLHVDKDFEIGDYPFLFDNTIGRDYRRDTDYDCNTMSIVEEYYGNSWYSYLVRSTSLIVLVNGFEKYGYRLVDRAMQLDSATGEIISETTMHKELEEEESEEEEESI